MTIKADRYYQFESSLFDDLSKLLSTHRIHKTAFHPKSNGMIQCFHRRLKTALLVHSDSDKCVRSPINYFTRFM